MENARALDSNLSQIRETDQILVKIKIFMPQERQIIQTLPLFSTLE